MKALLLALVLAGQSGPAATIIDFGAKWCGYCKQLDPAIKKLENANYPIRRVDIDEEPRVANKYSVKGVPTLVIVDADGNELDRISGVVSAKEIGDRYKSLMATTEKTPESAIETDSIPVAATVRIMIGNSIGSGTIVHSDQDKSIILTCSHIFKTKSKSISVEVFGSHAGKYDGTEITHDPATDLGLIEITPGRLLPSVPIVPKTWQAKPSMAVTQVGCPHGGNPSSFQSRIKKVGVDLGDGSKWRGIECERIPKQGRSGGGLFTDNGFLIGVCDFASPQTKSGLYSGPDTIYALLDGQGLASLYESPGASPKLAAKTREVEPKEVELNEAHFRLFQAWCRRNPPQPGAQGEQGPVGPVGPIGPTGLTGKNGKDGLNGVDGKDGVNGKDGASISQDQLNAILARLAVLEAHDKMPVKLGVTTPDGKTKTELLYPDYVEAPKPLPTEAPAKARIGIDLSKFAVPIPPK
jgi:thiol-disulfide isomerase/thioredoxin